jgi:ABC-type iron transport system FetAB ATPase subunit
MFQDRAFEFASQPPEPGHTASRARPAEHTPMDTMPPVLLETRSISRLVDGKMIVNNISIQLRPAEIVAVSGPSGAGKSSFLRLLNRLDEPTGGDVLLDGVDYREISPLELRRRIGMVMQAAHLFPGTVLDNVRFGPLQHGETVPSPDIDALLDRIGLPGYAHRDVQHLSGGEAQRVSIARTLVNNPSTLLLDEPTSALDENSAREIESLITGLVEERQLACIIVTHNTAQALRIAPRTMMIVAGAMVAIGPTREVLDAR